MCFLAGVCLQKIKLEEGRNFAVLCRFPGSSGIPNKQTDIVPECHLYRALEAPPEKGLCFCLLISCPEVEFVSW